MKVASRPSRTRPRRARTTRRTRRATSVWRAARRIYKDDGATLDDVREAVTTLEEIKRIAQRVFGGVHPITLGAEGDLRDARAALRVRETSSPPRSA
jgi:hypothetical protein